MKTICIYHKNCFDGICAAWVISKVYPDAELMPMNYGDSLDWLTQGWNQGIYSKKDRLIVVDFSFPRATMLSLRDMFDEMLVLDHHKTAQANCEGLDFCVFDMKMSGAELVWWYYSQEGTLPAKTPRLVKYVADRDLWKFDLPDSAYINAYIQSFKMNIKEYELLYKVLENELDFQGAIIGGMSIERYKDAMVEAICKNAALDKDGIPTVNTSILFSEVGHELCKMYPDKPYSRYYFDRLRDNTRQFGLRSIGDFDVSEVAKTNGGGGHKNAAGYQHSLSEL